MNAEPPAATHDTTMNLNPLDYLVASFPIPGELWARGCFFFLNRRGDGGATC